MSIPNKIEKMGCLSRPGVLDSFYETDYFLDPDDELGLSRSYLSPTLSEDGKHLQPTLGRAFLAPLHLVSLEGLDEIVQWLLDRRASIDLQAKLYSSNPTPLFLAIFYDKIPTAKLLISKLHGAQTYAG
jgi:hypothetical protein